MKLEEFKNIKEAIVLLMSEYVRLEKGLDKIDDAAVQIEEIQSEIQRLKTLSESSLDRLSKDILEENCIYLHLVLNHSFKKIAAETGNIYSSEKIRRMCRDYEW